MIMLRNLRARCSVADAARIRTVLHVSLPIRSNRTKVEVSQMPPTLQHDSPLEWLPFGSHNDAIVFAPCVWIVFAPVQFETFKSQRVDGDKQILGPLVTITAFPQAVINEEVIENRRTKHTVLPPELGYGGERAVCENLCFVTTHSWRK